MPDDKAPQTIEQLQTRIGITFTDAALLRRAMTHRSFTNETGMKVEDNERLEFLGDATLNFISGDLLFERFPDRSEGWLTRLRAALVRTESLAAIAQTFGLGQVLLMGRGEEANGGRERDSTLCDAFEALVGAMYLDQGIMATRAFVRPLLEQRLEVVLEEALHWDARTLLQEWSQLETGITPAYELIGESGPEHDKAYEMEVRLGEEVAGRGIGHSKRAAAQAAARNAIKAIKARDDIEFKTPPER